VDLGCGIGRFTILAAMILKADGILAIHEHEMKESKFLGIVEGANLFTLVEKEKRLYKFRPLREGQELYLGLYSQQSSLQRR